MSDYDSPSEFELSSDDEDHHEPPFRITRVVLVPCSEDQIQKFCIDSAQKLQESDLCDDDAMYHPHPDRTPRKVYEFYMDVKNIYS